MTDTAHVEELTPLDLVMPPVYIRVLLVFSFNEPTLDIPTTLQHGLNVLCDQLPWLAGRVLQASPASRPHIHYGNTSKPTIANKGSIAAPYLKLAADSMPPTAIPEDVWPVPAMVDGASPPSNGAPVFAASFFRFADDKAVGICMCMHHNVVDATGFAEVLGIWARNTSIEGTIVDIHHHEYRQSRLSTALSAHLEPTHARSLDSLLDAHPEYSRSPPQLPQALPAYTTKLFGIPTSRLDEAKGLVSEYIPKPTTNTILSALVWLGITRARAQRVSQFNEDELITLISAVNSRRRVFGSESPYFGNMVLYALSKLPMNQMSSVINENEAPPELIAKLCTAISESQSSNRIDADHIAEVYSLVDRWDDPRTLFPGWDLFNSRNVTVTSWAGLDLYGVDFGRGLGKPEFVRIPASQADGVVILLPRRMVEARETVGSKDGSRELAEVMIMLREDDMKALEGDKFIAEFWNEAENISCRV